jgi:threonine dehydrogenase-like Zn-dependent dehydrogenase
MHAVCWFGKKDVRVEQVSEPKLLNAQDAIVEVTLTAICGSDLHLYGGFMPTMVKGDVLGHEFMGKVVEVGKAVKKLKVGDRVVVGFPISCGKCFFCERELFSLCENSNPNAYLAEKLLGHSAAGIFGYSHLTGGFAGGQAEFVRVPFADVGTIKIESDLSDEQVLFLSDIFPTGYMAAENCNILPGDTVAVWGCGPVGQFTIRSAFLLGAEDVIAIDRIPERLKMASEGGATTINFDEEDPQARLLELTGGRGPDSCVDAVGMEAHSHGITGLYDRTAQAFMLETDRPEVFREAVRACRSGGTVSVPGVYGGLADKIPIGAVMNKALTIKSGQTHVPKYLSPLLKKIEDRQIDPSFVISHRLKLQDAPSAYEMFRSKTNACIKVVMTPH